MAVRILRAISQALYGRTEVHVTARLVSAHAIFAGQDQVRDPRNDDIEGQHQRLLVLYMIHR
jgi:hypothetical protein